jgi:hypothetical protein
MNDLDIYMAMAKSGLGTTWPHGKPYFKAKPKEPKPCLECKKEHFHNNSWCSVDCCKTWRLKEKQAKS